MSPDEETPAEPVEPAESTAEKKTAAKAEAKKPAAKKAAAKKEPVAKDEKEVKAEAAEATEGEKPAKKAVPAKQEPEAKKTEAKETEAQEAEAKESKAKAEKKPAAKASTEAEKKPAESKKPARKATPKAPRRRVVRAHARYVRTSARKARMVSSHLPGKTVDEARAMLEFTPREVARDWSKLLESAVANAEHNHELLEEDLIVREAYADEGPTIKRFRPRAMGRATPINKRTSHLTITLTTGS